MREEKYTGNTGFTLQAGRYKAFHMQEQISHKSPTQLSNNSHYVGQLHNKNILRQQNLNEK